MFVVHLRGHEGLFRRGVLFLSFRRCIGSGICMLVQFRFVLERVVLFFQVVGLGVIVHRPFCLVFHLCVRRRNRSAV